MWTWSDPEDPSLGVFAAVIDELVGAQDDFGAFGGLGYSVGGDADVVWIVPPHADTDAVSIEHVVDLEGDGVNELVVRLEFDYGEKLLLVRRKGPGFVVQEIYSLGC